MIVGAIVLTLRFSSSWLVWTVMVIAMLAVFGRHHPSTFDEDVPLDRTRMALALAALVVFVLSFPTAPIQPLDLIGRCAGGRPRSHGAAGPAADRVRLRALPA